jgi:hypothetical protein
MRSTFITVTCLCTVLIALPVLAKDKKSAKQMDPQAMMELYKQLGTPGEPHKLFASPSRQLDDNNQGVDGTRQAPH